MRHHDCQPALPLYSKHCPCTSCLTSTATPVRAVTARLANATYTSERRTGRVELLRHGNWVPACASGFNAAAATVFCRSLGLGHTGVPVGGAPYGRGSGDQWLESITCSGAEPRLDACKGAAWTWGSPKCDHGSDVGVVCTGWLGKSVSPQAWCPLPLRLTPHAMPRRHPGVQPSSTTAWGGGASSQTAASLSPSGWRFCPAAAARTSLCSRQTARYGTSTRPCACPRENPPNRACHCGCYRAATTPLCLLSTRLPGGPWCTRRRGCASAWMAAPRRLPTGRAWSCRATAPSDSASRLGPSRLLVRCWWIARGLCCAGMHASAMQLKLVPPCPTATACKLLPKNTYCVSCSKGHRMVCIGAGQPCSVAVSIGAAATAAVLVPLLATLLPPPPATLWML